MQPLYKLYRSKASTYRALNATTRAEKRAAVETRRKALARSKPGRAILQKNAVTSAKRATTIAQKQTRKVIPTTAQPRNYSAPYNYVVTITAHHIPTQETSIQTIIIAAEHALTAGELYERVLAFMERVPSLQLLGYSIDAAYHA